MIVIYSNVIEFEIHKKREMKRSKQLSQIISYHNIVMQVGILLVLLENETFFF